MVRVTYPSVDPAYEEFYENQKWQGERNRQTKRKQQNAKRTKRNTPGSSFELDSTCHLVHPTLQNRLYWKHVVEREVREASAIQLPTGALGDADHSDTGSLASSALSEPVNQIVDLALLQEAEGTEKVMKRDVEPIRCSSAEPLLTDKDDAILGKKTELVGIVDKSWLLVNNCGELETSDLEDDFEWVDKVIFA